MGKRIAFYETKNGKSLKNNLLENYSEFKKWILIENQNSLNEYNERIVSVEIQEFLESNAELDLQKPEQKLLDELLIEFLLVYCDYGKGTELVNLIGPLIKTHKYDKSFKIISKEKNRKLIEIWNILKVGRSLRNDKPSTNIDGDLIGFWKSNELKYLNENLKNIKRKYDIGIECITQVLAEIGKGKEELIIVIEI